MRSLLIILFRMNNDLLVLISSRLLEFFLFFFFFNDPATTEIYTLFPTRRSSDLRGDLGRLHPRHGVWPCALTLIHQPFEDRKSTRLNSSHVEISYAVFCLKKKNAEHGPDENYPEQVLDR